MKWIIAYKSKQIAKAILFYFFLTIIVSFIYWLFGEIIFRLPWQTSITGKWLFILAGLIIAWKILTGIVVVVYALRFPEKRSDIVAQEEIRPPSWEEKFWNRIFGQSRVIKC